MTDKFSFESESPEDVAATLEVLWEQAVKRTDYDADFCARVLNLIIESQRVMRFDHPWSVDIAAAIVDVDRGKVLLALSRLRLALVGSAVIDPKVMAARLGA